MSFKECITSIKGIGKKKKALFNKAGIYTIEDLIYYFPRTYEDRGNVKRIRELEHGEKTFIKIEIKKMSSRKIRKGLIISSIEASDGYDRIDVHFFNSQHRVNKFFEGQSVYVYGKVKKNRNRAEMQGVEIYSQESAQTDGNVGKIVPVYKLSGKLSNSDFCRAVKGAIEKSKSKIEKEYIPQSIVGEENLCPLEFAIRNIHFPKDRTSLKEAMYRMIFEEFFIMHCKIKWSLNIGDKPNKNRIKRHPGLDNIIDSLPFKLTGSQESAINEILSDMDGERVMNRLLQGDVGCGKTIIAMVCMANCALSGYQSLIMAPTEVLANQHYKSFIEILEKFDIKTEILTGSTKKEVKNEIYAKMESGEIDILIGTHSLIQDGLRASNVVFAVTDEQHRFGVDQRMLLSKKGNSPHMLYMSATPIPRSLAMSVYSDMDMTVVRDLPKGRKKVITSIVSNKNREKLYSSLVKRLEKGEQAYVVCPLVQESDSIKSNSAVMMHENLCSIWKGRVKVGLLHGRLSAYEKEKTIKDFKNSNLQVIVCTTVVEVGVDAPNANIIIVENAERFGLSQLHQLRGRVGRGSRQSYCIMVCESDSTESAKRLNIIKQSSNGFEIARRDLEIRGPGELSGLKQHGISDFKLADVFKHSKILQRAKAQADKMFENEGRIQIEESDFFRDKVIQNRNTDVC